jgi:hypothetical protein
VPLLRLRRGHGGGIAGNPLGPHGRFLSCPLAALKLKAPSMSVPGVASIMCCPSRVLVFSSPLTWPHPRPGPRGVGEHGGHLGRTSAFHRRHARGVPLRAACRTEEGAMMGAPTGRGRWASATMDSTLLRFSSFALAVTAPSASLVAFLDALVERRFRTRTRANTAPDGTEAGAAG